MESSLVASSESLDVPLVPGAVRIYPFGGVGAFGMNCLAIEQRSGILVIDCGAMFAGREFGIELEHPDFSWLEERAERIQGLVLTHGHEDHIGAVPQFLARLDVPVWGSRYVRGLVERRLAEAANPISMHFHETVPRRTYAIGSFEVEPIRVAHSIVEATALAIKTDAGIVVHSGDFNFDPDPPDGEPTDSERLREVGDAGVALLLSDSTNADVPERSGSERSVGQALERAVEEASGRVVIAMFSSNVQRLMLLGEVARRASRKLCLLGRSLESHARIAREAGRLHWPSDLVIAKEDAQAKPANELLVLSGGTQAEAQSALRRLASGTLPALCLEAGDTVVLSSRVIPGNERPVVDMICDLLRQGIVVRHSRTDPDVHTSGHAGRSEQRRMLELLRPKAFVPLHGTLHHLLKHAELARSVGVTNVAVVENGEPVEFDGGELVKLQAIQTGKVAIAIGQKVLERVRLGERMDLARFGVVVLSLAVTDDYRLLEAPRIFDCGIPLGQGSSALKRRVESEVNSVLMEQPDMSILEDLLRRRLRRALQDLCGYRPIVEVHLTLADYD